MLKAEIKNKIKQLLKEKKVNKAELSRSFGKDKTLINSIIYGKNSFFSLDHVEKICAAIDYPVYKLFLETPEQAQEQFQTSEQQIIMDVLKKLSIEDQRKILKEVLLYKEKQDNEI